MAPDARCTSPQTSLTAPTEQAVTVALRTQQILAHETGVTRVTDPLGGSWFIESLTDKMEQEALAYIAEIDDMGGGAWVTARGPAPSTTTRDREGAVSSPSPTSRDREGAVSPFNSGGYGGAVQGIHRGYFRRKIAEASYRFSEECEAGDRIIVGLNQYIDNDEKRPSPRARRITTCCSRISRVPSVM